MNKKAVLREDNFNYLTRDVCKYDEYEPEYLDKHACKNLKPRFSSNTKKAIQFAAKVNIPLYPRAGEKEVVLGTTKYLLPYYVCDKEFVTFTVPDELWNLKLNMQFLDCLMMDVFSKSDVIRLVTTRRDLMTDQGGLRVTAKEICYLKHKYQLKFYKLIHKDHDNIYFLCHKKPNSKCKMISGEEVEYN
jgi:hypothetical protein